MSTIAQWQGDPAPDVVYEHQPSHQVLKPVLERDMAILRETHGGIVRARFPFGSYPYGNAEGWIAIGYEEVRWAFSDPRFGLFGHRFDDYPRMLINQADKPPRPLSFIMMDGKDHITRRRIVSKHLNSRRVQTMRPAIEEIADSALDDVIAAGPGADMIALFAKIVPIAVVCELLGAPLQERDQFVPAAIAQSHGLVTSVEESEANIRAISGYFRTLAERRRAEPRDDLLSDLIADADAQGWSEEELHGIGHTLLSAGHDAPSSILGGMIYVLAHRPDLFEQLRARRDDLKGPIEEFLRYLPAGTGTRTRIAGEDIEAFGVHIRKGEVIQPLVHAGNYDPSRFDSPDEVDIDRPDNHHLRFAFGPHACPGAQIARLELEVALRRVLERFSGLRSRDTVTGADWLAGIYARGPRTLPVEWTLA
jgi:nocardicin N-oxygenase